MSDQKRNCRRRYDRQFKEDAVALVRGGRALTQVASDLGITSVGMLSEWRKKIEAGEALTERKTLQALSPEQREIAASSTRRTISPRSPPPTAGPSA